MKNIKLITNVSAILMMLFVSCTTNENTEEGNLYRILVGEKYGFIDERGKIIIEPQYDLVVFPNFTENLCYVEAGDKNYLINKSGDIKVEIADSIKWVADFAGGIACFSSDYINNGIIDSTGAIVIPAIYKHAYVNKDGDNVYILVEGRKDSLDWFMADKQGNQIGPKCDSILSGFEQGMCAVKMNGKWGYMDEQGNLAIDTIYDFARVFTKDGLARVCKDGKDFFIDKKGKSVISVDKTISGFTGNRAAVILKGEKCLIDKNGNKICNLDCYDDCFIHFGEEDHLATVIKNGKASKIDTMGNVVLKTQFEDIREFHNGVALARNNGKWGAIDMSGKVIVNFAYEIARTDDNKKMLIFFNTTFSYGYPYYSFYNYEGDLIWQDLPQKHVPSPISSNRKDFVEYYDANIANLDPIEGIYYVTNKNYYQQRSNLNEVGMNSSHSLFYAVVRSNPDKDEFNACCIDGSNMMWVNKFVKLGNSNNYAIVKDESFTENKYSSEGRVDIDDFNTFEFRLEQDNNGWCNFFVTYEFVRDYPTVAEYEQYQRADWTGSGFAIADGVIATNYHVANGAKTIRVKGVNGDFEKSYKGFVMASDKEHDLAVIKIVDAEFESFGSIPYKVGRATVNTGDDIFVLGYPMTSTMGNEVKLTDGIISSTTGFKGDASMYQISAAVQPGNSGGPVFDSEGNVIGIVCGKHTDAENANYAIKVSYLFSLLDASNCNVKVADKNNLNTSKLSSKVKKVKDFVYLIECRSK